MRALIVRRRRGRLWVYGLWLFIYLSTALMFAGEMYSGAGLLTLSSLLVPIMVVVGHMFYPTMLGWLVIFIPSVLYAGVGVYYLIRNASQVYPQWSYDLSSFIMGCIFVGALIALCVALMFARPKLRYAHE